MMIRIKNAKLTKNEKRRFYYFFNYQTIINHVSMKDKKLLLMKTY